MASFDSAPEFDGYTKVVITVSEDVEYSAGVDTGRTLTLENPWGTQAMADNILASIRGFKYQPYTATDAVLDPAAELGDGITANNVYGGIYTMSTRFGPHCRATVSAPAEEELDHEYPYVPKQERKVNRSLYHLSSELKVQAGLISAEVTERKSDVESINGKMSVQAGEIAAKVNRTGGDPSSFGWNLYDSSWSVTANNTDVLKATKNGLEVYGKITATSGKIGGFDILSNHLSYNNQTWGGTNTTGGYFGVNGLQLGKNFKVDMTGHLEASSGTFSGFVKAGSIQYGGEDGTLSGSALTPRSVSGGSGGQLGRNTLSTYNLAGGINTSLGYADFSNGIFGGWNTANYMYANTSRIKTLTVTDSLVVPNGYGGTRKVSIKSLTIDGNVYNFLTI